MKGKMSGPHAIRSLASATSVYLQMVQDTATVIRMAIEESGIQREMEYARLLVAMTQTERDLRWLSENCAKLLGES